MFEEKHVNYTNIGEIQKYQVTFAKHSHIKTSTVQKI